MRIVFEEETPGTTLAEFAEQHDLTLRVTKLTTATDHARYVVRFDEGIADWSVRCHGEGWTMNAAMADYARKLRGMIVYAPQLKTKDHAVRVPRDLRHVPIEGYDR